MALTIATTIVEHYDIGGSTLQAAVNAFPNPNEAGECTWAMPFEHDGPNRRGLPVRFRMTLQVTIRMPRWTGVDAATGAERTEWNRFYAALLAHERGHETRTRSAVPVTHDRLAASLVRDLESVFAREEARIQAISDRYDGATQNGRRPPPGTNITIPPTP